MLKGKICFGIVILMGIVGLAGCGQKNAKSVLEGSKPVLKALNVYMNEDYNKAKLTSEIADKTGYTVQYDMLPRDKAEDKLNLIVSSSDAYDFIVIDGTMKERYSYYAKNGALLELDELVEKYGQNMKKTMSEQTFDGLKVNDKLYGIGTANVSVTKNGTINSMMAVRSDMLKKYNIKIPTTLDQFTEMLVQIKNNDKNAIPLSVSSNLDVPGIAGAFGIPNAWNEKDGKLVHKITDPMYREYLLYMKELYQKNLLDSEMPTNKNATVEEKFISGNAVIAPIAWTKLPSINTALQKNSADAKVNFINAPKGKDGQMGIGANVGGYDRITFIPKSAKNPEHAIAYMNMKLEENLFKFIAIGNENEHYTVKDGDYYPIVPKFFDERGNANNYFNGINEKEYPKYWLARVRKDMQLYNAYNYMNIESQNQHIPNVIGYIPMLPTFAEYNQILTQKVEDFAVKVVAGETPIEKLDSFIAEWKSKGGDEMTKELNDWYVTFKSNSK